MKRRQRTPEEKLEIVMEGIKERKSIAEICRTHGISQTLFYRWREQFFEGGKKGLTNGKTGEAAYRAEIEKLQKIIGKQAIVIDTLKKTDEMFGRR